MEILLSTFAKLFMIKRMKSVLTAHTQTLSHTHTQFITPLIKKGTLKKKFESINKLLSRVV